MISIQSGAKSLIYMTNFDLLSHKSVMYLLFVWFSFSIGVIVTSANDIDDNQTHGIQLVSVNFPRVGILIVVSLWILLVCVSITAFHYMGRLSHVIPESCLLIILGLPIGSIYRWGNVVDYFKFTPDLFFLILLPPIVLDAGYFVRTRAFFENIVPILLHAIIGTLFNAFALGLFLYLCSNSIGIPSLGLMHCLLFGSLISAVDPVAVLAVFNELQVHELLFIIVFGESILNDAVTIVLYNLFEYLVGTTTVGHKEILTGVGSFFIVSIMGVIIGVFFGLLTAFVTKFTKIFRLLEPVIVLVLPYIGYLIAELFHFSGILSILFCGIIMKPYVEINVSYKSKITIQRILRAISTTSEAIIFVFLGSSLFITELEWNTGFVLLTLLGVFVFRVISILGITFISNSRKPKEKVSWVEQFVMMYGGLRGAVAISLALILEEESAYKKLFVTTAFVVVLFTIFVQGITIKPLVRLLKIKIEPKKRLNMLEEMNFKMIDQLNICAAIICGTDRLSGIKKCIHRVETILEKFLTDKSKKARKDTILAANTDLLYKQAAKLVKTNPSAIINLTKSQDVRSTTTQPKTVVLEDVPAPDPYAHLRIHQSNLAKGQNLFDTYVKNLNVKAPISDSSEVNFMTRNESFYGPGATFTIHKKGRYNEANLQVPSNNKPIDTSIIQHELTPDDIVLNKDINQNIPMVVIHDTSLPLFNIGKHPTPIESVTMKELSESVIEPTKDLKGTKPDHDE